MKQFFPRPLAVHICVLLLSVSSGGLLMNVCLLNLPGSAGGAWEGSSARDVSDVKRTAEGLDQ
jgi:hypothetical protein